MLLSEMTIGKSIGAPVKRAISLPLIQELQAKVCSRSTGFRSYPHLIVSSCIYHVQINLNKICLNTETGRSRNKNEKF